MIARTSSAAVTELIDALANAFAGEPGVAGLFLFGSQARGRAGSDSDIDVAVLLEAPAPQGPARLDLLKRFILVAATVVASNRLHLVLLNDAPPALAFEVLRRGHQILCRNETAMHRFRVQTYRAHGDYELVEALFRRTIRARAEREARIG